MKALLLGAAALAAIAMDFPAQAGDRAQAARDVAAMGIDMSIYQTVCKTDLPIPVWDFILAQIKKYGADKEAARQEADRMLADRAKVGDGKFCVALTASVRDTMIPLIEYMIANPLPDSE